MTLASVGVFGTVYLGVYLDVVLIAGAVSLAVIAVFDAPRRREPTVERAK